jgi:prolipoprotein diacylglyceryltransferase
VIPFIRIAEAHVGPLVLHPFGLLVAAGVIVGSRLAVMRARAAHTDVTELNSFITWLLIGGFVGGHVLDELFYHPSEALRAPWSLLYLWAGLSSFGGFIGGIAAIASWRFFELRPVVDVGLVTLRWFQRRLNPRDAALSTIILAHVPPPTRGSPLRMGRGRVNPSGPSRSSTGTPLGSTSACSR